MRSKSQTLLCRLYRVKFRARARVRIRAKARPCVCVYSTHSTDLWFTWMLLLLLIDDLDLKDVTFRLRQGWS